MSNYQDHGFHLVDPSPWPLVTSVATLTSLSGAVMWFHGYNNGGLIASTGLIFLFLSAAIWWRDIIREGTFEGHHTTYVQRGLKFGMLLFIVSEVMFFFAFFWAYFHSSLVPNLEVGSVWPPLGITPFNPWGVPLLNTVILLSSGASVTWAHHALISGHHKQVVTGLVLTVVLAAIFTSLQALEYHEATFTIADGIYGSTFFLATGFHGIHVLIGTIFLTVCLFRQMKFHFTRQHHIGFEAAAWYWHFVDVVWLFLFVVVYWWGYRGF